MVQGPVECSFQPVETLAEPRVPPQRAGGLACQAAAAVVRECLANHFVPHIRPERPPGNGAVHRTTVQSSHPPRTSTSGRAPARVPCRRRLGRPTPRAGSQCAVNRRKHVSSWQGIQSAWGASQPHGRGPAAAPAAAQQAATRADYSGQAANTTSARQARAKAQLGVTWRGGGPSRGSPNLQPSCQRRALLPPASLPGSSCSQSGQRGVQLP